MKLNCALALYVANNFVSKFLQRLAHVIATGDASPVSILALLKRQIFSPTAALNNLVEFINLKEVYLVLQTDFIIIALVITNPFHFTW
jgi:hypothetical protein